MIQQLLKKGINKYTDISYKRGKKKDWDAQSLALKKILLTTIKNV